MMLEWSDSWPESRWFWLCILFFRVWNALFVRTYFNPDEFWQSTEVAHHLVFGYGHLTWEWQPDSKIRGYAHPLLFAALYKLLSLLHLDSWWAIAYGPRILQGLFAAWNDWFLYSLARTYFDRKTGKWALFCQVFSWFIFYTMVRTYSNSLETLTTTAALSYWPWYFLQTGHSKKNHDQKDGNDRLTALCVAALGVLFRPTSAVMWSFLGALHFFQCFDRSRLLFQFVLPLGVVTGILMVIVDYIGYGQWTFVPYNFFLFNVLEGKDKLYGVHPWHWYFTQGFPVITATFLPFFMVGFRFAQSQKRELGYMVLWTLFIYSNSQHKEFRFILPILPPAFVYAGYCQRNLELGVYNRFTPDKQKAILVGACILHLLANSIASIYLSRWHQSAPLAVMDFLAEKVKNHSEFSIHFWTPCHATPYYSHLHTNVSMWFPDCSPENRERPEGSDSDLLQENPMKFLSFKYQLDQITSKDESFDMSLPDYVVLYSDILDHVVLLLKQAQYKQEASFFHSHISGDADSTDAKTQMLVYSRRRE